MASAWPAAEALGLIPSVGGLLLLGKAAVQNAAQENDPTPRLHQKQGGERGGFTVSPKPLGQHLPTQQEGEGAAGKPPVRVSERTPPAEPTAQGELERGAQGSVLGCVLLTGAGADCTLEHIRPQVKLPVTPLTASKRAPSLPPASLPGHVPSACLGSTLVTPLSLDLSAVIRSSSDFPVSKLPSDQIRRERVLRGPQAFLNCKGTGTAGLRIRDTCLPGPGLTGHTRSCGTSICLLWTLPLPSQARRGTLFRVKRPQFSGPSRDPLPGLG